MDEHLKGNLFYKISEGKLIKLTRQERKRFIRKGFEEVYRTDLIISITYEEEDNDLGVFLWNDKYSIGVTHDEFLEIYNAIKDKERIISEIVASRV